MEQREDLTRLMYRMATSQTLGLRQAMAHLREDAYLRPIRETLARYAKKSPDDTKALQAFLVNAIMEQSLAGASRESVERKVRMWMKDGTQSISKSGAIQVSFALGLSAEEANRFLQRACGEGFHSRDPEEIIFLFALKEGLSYPKALALQKEMKEEGLLTQEKCGAEDVRTEIVRKDLDKLESVAGLRNFLRENRGRLGSFHNTAYEMFKGYMDLLTGAEINDGLEEESRLSVREVTDVYLHEKLVPRIRRAAKKDAETETLVLSALQRDIQQSWPDETALSKMMNRRTDISRKALILLFLATDGGAWAEDDREDDEEKAADEEAAFEDAYSRMDGMLMSCGFAPLDARCAFDWMVLYCMCVDAEDTLLIDDRIHRFLEGIFQPQPREDED